MSVSCCHIPSMLSAWLNFEGSARTLHFAIPVCRFPIYPALRLSFALARLIPLQMLFLLLYCSLFVAMFSCSEKKKRTQNPRPALHSKHLLPTSIQLYIHHSPGQGCYYIPVGFTFRTSDLTYITVSLSVFIPTYLFIHSFLPIHFFQFISSNSFLYSTSKFKSRPSRPLLLAYPTPHTHIPTHTYTHL